jgi:hypothetical protein
MKPANFDAMMTPALPPLLPARCARHSVRPGVVRSGHLAPDIDDRNRPGRRE